MKVSIIFSMFALALSMGEPVRSQACQSEKTVPIGGNVTLMCPLPPEDIWTFVYWKKNNDTVYSFNVKSKNVTTKDGRYEGSNHATRLTIKDLKNTDSGIYHCKVATLVSVKERGQVLLSVIGQDGGINTTSPCVPCRAFTTVPPQPAEAPKNFLALSISFFIIAIIINIITGCLVFKYPERLKNSRLVRACKGLVPRRSATSLVCNASYSEPAKEDTNTRLLSSDTHDRNCVNSRPEESSEQPNQSPLGNAGASSSQCMESTRQHNSAAATSTPDRRTVPNYTSQQSGINDPIYKSVNTPKHCRIIIDTPEFQRLRFIKQLGHTCYVFPTAVHTRFEHSLGVSHLGGKLASMLLQNDRNSSTAILNTEVACVEIACLCLNLGHVPFSHAFEDIIPLDKDGKKWKLEKQSVIMLKYLIKHNSLKKKLEEHNIYDKEIDFICQLILGVKNDEEMDQLRENKFFLYQIVNNSVNGVDVDKWDYIARDTHYLSITSTFDLDRILPTVTVLDVKRGSKTRRELCFRDKVTSNLTHMFLTTRDLHSLSYQHRVSKIVTIMLKDAIEQAADHLLFVGEGGKECNLLESLKDPKAFCLVNDTIVNEIMRSRSQEPGMVKARDIIERIHKRELYQCIAEYQHANEKMGTEDLAEIKRVVTTLITEPSSTTSPSSEMWQAHNIEVEVSRFDYGSGNRNPLLDIPFYKKSSDGNFVAEFLPVDELPADARLPQPLVDVSFRIYTKVPKLDRETIDKAKARCKTRLKQIHGSRCSLPTTPVKQKIKSPPIGTMAPSPLISAVRPLTSSSSDPGSFVSTDGGAGNPSLMSAKVTLDSTKRQIAF